MSAFEKYLELFERVASNPEQVHILPYVQLAPVGNQCGGSYCSEQRFIRTTYWRRYRQFAGSTNLLAAFRAALRAALRATSECGFACSVRPLSCSSGSKLGATSLSLLQQ